VDNLKKLSRDCLRKELKLKNPKLKSDQIKKLKKEELIKELEKLKDLPLKKEKELETIPFETFIDLNISFSKINF